MKFKQLLLREDFYTIDGKKFYDYGTESIKKWVNLGPYGDARPAASEVFDKTNLGVGSGYDKYLPERIVMMSPNQYFERCAKGFGTTFSEQFNGIKQNKDILNHLKDVLFVARKKLPMCYISDSNGSQQEGRHRMFVAGELYGWDRMFPVLLLP